MKILYSFFGNITYSILRKRKYNKFWAKINSPQGTLKEEDTIRYTNDSILSFA